MKETLSEKILPNLSMEERKLLVKDVKEFIEELIEAIPYKKTAWAKLMRLEIISRAGEGLIK